MAHRKKAAATGTTGVAAGLSGDSAHRRRCCTASKPVRAVREGSIWGRRRVLLLNSTYEPLTALPMRRAVVMLMCGKADVVHDDPSGPVIHSATRSIAVPSVIRLRSFVRVPYRARIPMTRAALMHRDRFRCAYCGAKADTVDHVVPRSRGGDHSWENCVARLLDVQPPQGRPAAGRAGLVAARDADCRPRVSTGGCCRRSRNSTRRGCDIWVRARPEPVAAIGFAP